MEDNSKSKIKMLLDVIAGCILSVGVLVYLVVGLSTKVWHPTWLIIVVAALVGLIANLVADCVEALRAGKKCKAQIYCDMISGSLGIIGLIVYLIIGIICRVWHPTWLIFVVTAVVCSIAEIIVLSVVKTQAKDVDANQDEKV